MRWSSVQMYHYFDCGRWRPPVSPLPVPAACVRAGLPPALMPLLSAWALAPPPCSWPSCFSWWPPWWPRSNLAVLPVSASATMALRPAGCGEPGGQLSPKRAIRKGPNLWLSWIVRSGSDRPGVSGRWLVNLWRQVENSLEKSAHREPRPGRRPA